MLFRQPDTHIAAGPPISARTLLVSPREAGLCRCAIAVRAALCNASQVCGGARVYAQRDACWLPAAGRLAVQQ